MSSRPSHFTLSRPGPLRLYSTAELLRLPPPEWLIDGLVPKGALAVMWGPSNCGKSFVALDMALSVGTGMPWQGHAVNETGRVIYIAAEGGTGIQKRVLAWLAHYRVPANLPRMAWVIETALLNPDTDEDAAGERLLARLSEIDEQPVLIVIDTLARCLEGNENQQEDMGRFVAGVDRIRHECGCAVIVVHHSGWNEDRMRGSTSLKGAVDTEIKVEKPSEGELIVSCNKQRDSEWFQPMEFSLRVIEGTDSCVVASTESSAYMALTKILDFIGKPARHKEIMCHALSANTSKRSLNRALRLALKNGEIIKENDHYRKVSATQK